MGESLHRRKAPARNAIDNHTERASDESRIVAQAYLAWPIALIDRLAPRENASSWYRLHMRQARWFGAIVSVALLIAFAWPLVASFFVGSAIITLWLYGCAMMLDIALFVLWLLLAIRYSRRAARGDLFTIPLVAALTGTWSRKP